MIASSSSSPLSINIYSASVRIYDKVPPVYPMRDKYFAASSVPGVSKYDEIAISVSKLQIPEIIASRGWRRGPGDTGGWYRIPRHSSTAPSVSTSGIPPHSKPHIMDHAQDSGDNNPCRYIKTKSFSFIENQNFSNGTIVVYWLLLESLGTRLGRGYDNLSQIWWMSGLSPGDNISITAHQGRAHWTRWWEKYRKICIYLRRGTFASFMSETWYPCVCHFSDGSIKT